ncbi:hypothetical protein [Roseateles sp. BYS78W]
MLLLIGFVVGTPMVGGNVFVASALQRGEFYAGLAADAVPDAGAARALVAKVAQHVHAHAHKSVGKLTLLNLFLHLKGIAAWALPGPLPGAGDGARRAVVGVLPRWQLVFAIFEPPWGRPSLR